MATVISPRVTLLSRAEWGASQFSYRLGGADDPRGGRRYISANERTHHFFHHSVIVDNDVSKNIWETLSEVRVNMRVIQRARPDLGGGYKDVPYSWVIYLRPNAKITVCEGRGAVRSGAHTGGRDVRNIHHNISALASCIAGNTELRPSLAPWIPAFNDWLAHLKSGGFNRIEELHPPTGARAGFKLPAKTYGHRHVSATTCPGENMWKILPQMSFEEEDDMSKPYGIYRLEGTTGSWNWTGAAFYKVTGEEFKQAKRLGLKTPVPEMKKAEAKLIRKRLHMD